MKAESTDKFYATKVGDMYGTGDRWCGLITANLEIEPITILPRTDECMSSGTYTTLEFDHKTIRAIAYAHS